MAESIDEFLQQANQAHAAGHLAEAEGFVQQALAAKPEDPSANLLMGVLAGKTGRDALAQHHLTAVLARNPESFEALFWLSIINRRGKRLNEAIDYAQKAVALRPADAHAQNNVGLCFLDALKLEEAVTSFQLAASIRSDLSPIYHNLGTALYLLGRDIDAAKAFDRALLISPKSVDSYLSFGQVMLSQTNPEAAARCAKRALVLKPESASAELLLASALVEDSLTGEAELHLKRAIELNPSDSRSQGLLGQRYQSLGKFAEANEHLRKSIELEPRQGFAYFAYVHNNKITEDDRPMIQAMEKLVAEGGLDPRQLNFLHYGLGRSFEMLREYEKAMRHFDEANRIARKLKFGDAVFDRERYISNFDWLMETYSHSFIEHQKKAGYGDATPVVIVGMMRSGTTLAEQILSSHPQIGAAGEQKFWPHSHPSLYGKDNLNFQPSALPTLGRRYVELLKKIAPSSPHITDKNPANYENLGAIHCALPNARIIHMRRHPLDTCISIYATPNRIPVDFAYDKDNIVFAYEQYLRLMEHWRSVLPEDRFIEVNYEDVVADREQQARRMLQLIGLDWDDALLSHETNQRNVITPSLWQVRQPIYTTSIERWRRYEPWLGGFRKLLVEN
jgi:tetratricopeptide (TPR) repeat protein